MTDNRWCFSWDAALGLMVIPYTCLSLRIRPNEDGFNVQPTNASSNPVFKEQVSSMNDWDAIIIPNFLLSVKSVFTFSQLFLFNHIQPSFQRATNFCFIQLCFRFIHSQRRLLYQKHFRVSRVKIKNQSFCFDWFFLHLPSSIVGMKISHKTCRHTVRLLVVCSPNSLSLYYMIWCSWNLFTVSRSF